LPLPEIFPTERFEPIFVRFDNLTGFDPPLIRARDGFLATD
jgi:hypothetical protein